MVRAEGSSSADRAIPKRTLRFSMTSSCPNVSDFVPSGIVRWQNKKKKKKEEDMVISRSSTFNRLACRSESGPICMTRKSCSLIRALAIQMCWIAVAVAEKTVSIAPHKQIGRSLSSIKLTRR